MHKLIAAILMLALFAALQAKAFADTPALKCKFKNFKVEGVQSIELNNDSLIINKDLEIPLEKTQVRCANFGRQVRLDGSGSGYQVVLKSCTTDAQLEGHLIDSIQKSVADVVCD